MKHIDDYTASRIVRAFTEAGCADTYLPMMKAEKVGALRSMAHELCKHFGIKPTVGNILDQWCQIMDSGEDHEEFGPSLLRGYVGRLEDLLNLERI